MKIKSSIISHSSIDVALMQKDRFNAFQGGYGAYKNKKKPARHDRKKDDKKLFSQY